MVNPSELEKVEFSTAFRGYNADQVDEYIDKVVQKYSEAYNNALEYEKLCKSQLEKIQLLERRLDAKESELNGAEKKKSDSDYAEYSEYKNKALELRDFVRECKANIFALYQTQIKELQSFDVDTKIDEVIAEKKADTEANSKGELMKDDTSSEAENENPAGFVEVDNLQDNEGVSENKSVDEANISEDDAEKANVDSLISELSSMLSVDLTQNPEEDVQDEPESTKVSLTKKIFDDDNFSDNGSSSPINPTGKHTDTSYSSMFITE